MIGRIDQQIRVNKIMIDVMGAQDFTKKDPHLKKYMRIYLSKIMTVTSMMLILDGSGRHLQDDIWAYLKSMLRRIIRHCAADCFGIAMNLPGRWGRNSQSEHTVQRGIWRDSTKISDQDQDLIS